MYVNIGIFESPAIFANLVIFENLGISESLGIFAISRQNAIFDFKIYNEIDISEMNLKI